MGYIEKFSGTPYLIASDADSLARFSSVEDKATRSQEKSTAVQARISAEGQELFEPYMRAIRSHLVAESNSIEGYDWSHSQVSQVALMYKELLQAPVGSLMQAVRQDSRVYQALGLYKAHEIADEWAKSTERPREYEIRSLHALIASGEPHAGKYKTQANEIGGTNLRTADPWDVALKMRELSDWWQSCPIGPALEATIVHAWLTHIHPFEDGNGRMARILANLALARNRFPPLLIQSRVDRGQYYDALAQSDEGDLLPLYDLFVGVLSRTVRIMSKPDYVRGIIKDRLLTTSHNRYVLWKTLPERYFGALSAELKDRGWSMHLQGYPNLESFALLEERDSEGNSWFAKVVDEYRVPRWLLWYGFASQKMLDVSSEKIHYPSIFTSIRDNDPTSVHPYKPHQPGGDFPDEIVLRPLEKRPVLFRSGYDVDELDFSTAARYMADALASP